MRILILTQPLRTNYGGLLQAFALQKKIKELGYDVVTNNSPFKERRLSFKIVYIIYRTLRGGIFRNKHYLPIIPNFLTKSKYKYIAQNTDHFIKNNINTTDFFSGKNQPTKTEINKYDVFIVGSDQVWRKRYSNLHNYFLGFLNKNTNSLKIAYAASFGTDNLAEYSKNDKRKCAKLAQLFDRISVREDSALKICKDQFCINAEQVLDPTLLLEKKEYLEIIKEEPERNDNTLLCYILDKTNEKQVIIEEISNKLALTSVNNMPIETFNGKKEQNISNCIFPSVSKWLAGFRDANFVVTDSFHGTVFAIIFNKPFISIGNKKRGITRFTSLLKIFDLEYRLISTEEQLSDKHFQKIDYTKVNTLKTQWQNKSIQFLLSNLNK
ncbi:polysaccharide pyruvyl transferase family protein [Sunxiuqinia rutila]|uniref:polysaccharide pyruvyl transferase family protein n=1 Tax=Sunxiuqinia rutila TaxID=1397841 RepID=UPI003D35D9C9